jgi:hypothetical protein
LARRYGRIGDVYFRRAKQPDGRYVPQIATSRRLLFGEPKWKDVGEPQDIGEDVELAAFRYARAIDLHRNG